MNAFRLILRDVSTLSVGFESTREVFKLKLADAWIDLCRKHVGTPVALEIGYHIPARGTAKAEQRWIGLPEALFPDGRLPSSIRWECAGDLYDHLIKVREERQDYLSGQRKSASFTPSW